MPRYSFHDQLNSIKRDPKYVLPADINAPVLRYLESIDCKIGADLVLAKQAHVGYGTVELIHDDAPNARLVIQFDAGMVGEWKKWVQTKAGKWTAIDISTVKNANIDKRKPKGVVDGKQHD